MDAAALGAAALGSAVLGAVALGPAVLGATALGAAAAGMFLSYADVLDLVRSIEETNSKHITTLLSIFLQRRRFHETVDRKLLESSSAFNSFANEVSITDLASIALSSNSEMASPALDLLIQRLSSDELIEHVLLLAESDVLEERLLGLQALFTVAHQQDCFHKYLKHGAADTICAAFLRSTDTTSQRLASFCLLKLVYGSFAFRGYLFHTEVVNKACNIVLQESNTLSPLFERCRDFIFTLSAEGLIDCLATPIPMTLIKMLINGPTVYQSFQILSSLKSILTRIQPSDGVSTNVIHPLVEPFFRAIDTLKSSIFDEPNPLYRERYRAIAHCLYLLVRMGLPTGTRVNQMLDLSALLPQPGFFMDDIIMNYLRVLELLAPQIYHMPDTQPFARVLFSVSLLMHTGLPAGSNIMGQIFLVLHAAIPRLREVLDRNHFLKTVSHIRNRASLSWGDRQTDFRHPYECFRHLMLNLADSIYEQVDFDEEEPLLLLHAIMVAAPENLQVDIPSAAHRSLLKLFEHASSLSHIPQLADIARNVALRTYLLGSASTFSLNLDALHGFLAMSIFGPAAMDLVYTAETHVIDCDFAVDSSSDQDTDTDDEDEDEDEDEDDDRMPTFPFLLTMDLVHPGSSEDEDRHDASADATSILDSLMTTGRFSPPPVPFKTNYPQILWHVARQATNRDLLNIFLAFEAGCCSDVVAPPLGGPNAPGKPTPKHFLRLLDFAASRAAALLDMLAEISLAAIGISDRLDSNNLPIVHEHVLIVGSILLKWLQFICEAPFDFSVSEEAGIDAEGEITFGKFADLLPRMLSITLAVIDSCTIRLSIDGPSASEWCLLLMGYWRHLAPVLSVSAPAHQQSLLHVVDILMAFRQEGLLSDEGDHYNDLIRQMTLLLPEEADPPTGEVGLLFISTEYSHSVLVDGALSDDSPRVPTIMRLRRHLARAQMATTRRRPATWQSAICRRPVLGAATIWSVLHVGPSQPQWPAALALAATPQVNRLLAAGVPAPRLDIFPVNDPAPMLMVALQQADFSTCLTALPLDELMTGFTVRNGLQICHQESYPLGCPPGRMLVFLGDASMSGRGTLCRARILEPVSASDKHSHGSRLLDYEHVLPVPRPKNGPSSPGCAVFRVHLHARMGADVSIGWLNFSETGVIDPHRLELLHTRIRDPHMNPLLPYMDHSMAMLRLMVSPSGRSFGGAGAGPQAPRPKEGSPMAYLQVSRFFRSSMNDTSRLVDDFCSDADDAALDQRFGCDLTLGILPLSAPEVNLVVEARYFRHTGTVSFALNGQCLGAIFCLNDWTMPVEPLDQSLASGFFPSSMPFFVPLVVGSAVSEVRIFSGPAGPEEPGTRLW
ncbi:hypothetical protein H696_01099 [Fonticula alba]|uniref:Uncharacterized protein n=1 Tax=Fonticula alba TaxID=691883 RepID=A0A058ZBA5_FONAL|nr:hypothetical protein H696_01099 [Fonticula alba]KCV71679.1 hypothetical protein H696_01099 [Fonticula alba]|eukprot:XP_009493257.1 hypothetical protein H696_01099 [Fonticula alba]